MTTKEKLIYTITELFTEEQNEYLYKVLHKFTSGYLSKKDLCDISEIESHNFDTSLPSPYMDRIREIHPNFNTWSHVYDYENNSFGELKNTCEEFVIKMNNVFSNH